MVRAGVLIVEDDMWIRREIAARVVADPELEVVAEVSDLAGVRRFLEDDSSASLALVDLELPDGNATEIIPLFRARSIAALVLTVWEDASSVYDAIAAGAGGYLLKSEALATVGEALKALRDGGAPISPKIARCLLDDLRLQRPPEHREEQPLTRREREVITLFAQGATYAEVARVLDMSVNTVRQHVRNIYDKLQVSSKAEAVMRALRRKPPY
jgi:DNA-binding NarL/FixJ family response regulator